MPYAAAQVASTFRGVYRPKSAVDIDICELCFRRTECPVYSFLKSIGQGFKFCSNDTFFSSFLTNFYFKIFKVPVLFGPLFLYFFFSQSGNVFRAYHF